ADSTASGAQDFIGWMKIPDSSMGMSAGRRLLRGDLPQRLLEYLRWLPAGHQVLALQDDGRHRADSGLHEVLLVGAHFVGERVGGKYLAGTLAWQARIFGDGDQRVVVGDVAPIGEVGAQQRLLERVLASFRP